MPTKKSVLIQMRYTPELLGNSPKSVASYVQFSSIPGFTLDESYTPVKIPARELKENRSSSELKKLLTSNARPELFTYVIRGEVDDDAALESLTEAVNQHPNGIGVFSNPRMRPMAVCPSFTDPVGTDEDVKHLLDTLQLHQKGMDGSNVMVAIVDMGINLDYLHDKGLNPCLDKDKSWTPSPENIPGQAPITGISGHGTMCAFDVCLSAPNCTLLDYQVLAAIGPETEPDAFDFYLDVAISAYGNLHALLLTAQPPDPAMVISNSWAMYDPSIEDDFPAGDPRRYQDNPNHPFNTLVEFLELAGADILFSAGDCGEECPGAPCQKGATNGTIYGANSSPSVLSIAAVTINKDRLGYSSQGPGGLCEQKPDLCAYSHFQGSGIIIEAEGFKSSVDCGTSAACPVAAGVVAAIRSVYPPSKLSPAQLRQILCDTAEDIGGNGFNYNDGYGLINVSGILKALDSCPDWQESIH